MISLLLPAALVRRVLEEANMLNVSQESREGYFVALRRKDSPTKDEVFAE